MRDVQNSTFNGFGTTGLAAVPDLHYHLKGGVIDMLELIAIVMVVLWLLGLVTSNTMGGLIHILLVIAIVVILLRVIRGRRIL
jgi:FtsH-binding integral membrane protein